MLPARLKFISMALFAAAVSAQSSCTEQAGNWYCSPVNAVSYTNVGGSGSYNMITNMDNTTGACTSAPYQYSGSLAPFNEELSVHIRGPVQLKSFAVYVPSASSNKKVRRHSHGHERGRRHSHRKRVNVAGRAVGTVVTATIDGQVVSWVNQYDGPGSPATTTSAAVLSQTTAAAGLSQVTQSKSATPATSQTSTVPGSQGTPPSSSEVPSTNGWTRTAYYDADSGAANGLVFLNHLGGQGSGIWDDVFGNSLSFANSSGTGGASSSQILSSTTLPSSAEIVIMSDEACGDENGSCGYYRPGTVAYHGFPGADKAFFFEFQMPSESQSGAASEYDAVNMPAIWFLNAQIPRTLQYGSADCSCWQTGCGELDAVEVLTPGYTMAKSTVHGNKAGGDSDYFVRPETGYKKMSVVMSANNFHINTLDEDVEFGDAMSDSVLEGLVSASMDSSSDVAVFDLAGAGSG